MTFRKIVSLSIALSFGVLMVTGFLSYWNSYSRVIATLHTVFGLFFTIGILLHLGNNFSAIKHYASQKMALGILLLFGLLFGATYSESKPFQMLMDYGAKKKATSKQEVDWSTYEVVKMELDKELQLTIDLLRAEHYWHPQMAIWIEDTLGNYLETIFVSKATAKGLFFGGRSKENFKEFDETQASSNDYRRVNALPVWSHKRAVKYEDGWYVPTMENPLPDAISSATIVDNFQLLASTENWNKFHVKVEINVAFDDNEYYSEFDYPDDEIFHSGTGQLGQPSILFEARIDMNDDKHYYLMDLIGHGHRSGQTGEVYKDLSTLTTAKEIVERIVVGVKRSAY